VLMKPVGSNGSKAVRFMMKVMVWYTLWVMILTRPRLCSSLLYLFWLVELKEGCFKVLPIVELSFWFQCYRYSCLLFSVIWERGQKKRVLVFDCSKETVSGRLHVVARPTEGLWGDSRQTQAGLAGLLSFWQCQLESSKCWSWSLSTVC
jgi:hypothetical protein